MISMDWLLAERQVGGLGTDTPGIDAGEDDHYSAGHICAANGLPHLENMAHLDQLPSTGAWILAAPLLLEGGTGSPARLFGLVP